MPFSGQITLELLLKYSEAQFPYQKNTNVNKLFAILLWV